MYKVYLFESVHKEFNPTEFNYVKEWDISEGILYILQESGTRHIIILKKGNYVEVQNVG